MNLIDPTRMQHFVSQSEQRLNAINPNARPVNQRIYSFLVSDRESGLLTIESERGHKIANTLGITDLFSFDVLRDEERYNFERLFHSYESSLEHTTKSLIGKLLRKEPNMSGELMDLFGYKFLNFLRNPYSVEKALNTFPDIMRNVHPTNPVHYANFRKIIDGSKPQEQHLCAHLGISEQDYTDWLSGIFLLLNPMKDEDPNYLDEVVRMLFGNRDVFLTILVHTYSKHACLLSDRGFSIPLPEDQHTSFDFNLYSNGFIRYVFTDIDAVAPAGTPQTLINRIKDSMSNEVRVCHMVDDMDSLRQYHQNLVYQCHERVLGSNREYCGLNINAA